MNNTQKIIIALVIMTTIGTAYTLYEPTIFDFIHVINSREIALRIGNSTSTGQGFAEVDINANNNTQYILLHAYNSSTVTPAYLRIANSNITLYTPGMIGAAPSQKRAYCYSGSALFNITSCDGKTGTYQITANGTLKNFVFVNGILISVT